MDIYEKAVSAEAPTAFSIFPRHQDPVLSEGNQAGMRSTPDRVVPIPFKKRWGFAENTIKTTVYRAWIERYFLVNVVIISVSC